MPEVIGIRFRPCGKIYDFETNGIGTRKGDAVIVESELGLGIGNVVIEMHTVTNASKELKKILRKATPEDIDQSKGNSVLEAESRAYCIEKITERTLPMKLVYTEVALDRKRIVFYFTSDGRIDFRDLVKDLAARFKTRIEMRQIGVRDEARAIGGFGMCGRELCCKTFLTSFEPISIKMAKRQDLTLNASKLSGVCGRLMCCLSYEYIGKPAAGTKETGDTAYIKPEEPIDTEYPASPAVANMAELSAKPTEKPAEKQGRDKHVSTPPRYKRPERTKRPEPARQTEEPNLHRTTGEKQELVKDSPPYKAEGAEGKAPVHKHTKKNRRRFQR